MQTVERHILESILDGGKETDSIEFKGAMDWDKNTLIKDILAMANVIDGGKIIVGVEDVTFKRVGLTKSQIQTYVIDNMRDQVAEYADPRVVFNLTVMTDLFGLDYAVIEVEPFEDIPVICSRDGKDVNRGTIYFRSRNRKPASARVDNSSDMREMVERAASLSIRRLSRIGFHPKQLNDYDYDAELDGL